MFIKTHSECFISYNKLQNNYFHIKNLSSNISYHFLHLTSVEQSFNDIPSNNNTFDTKDIRDFNDFKHFIDVEDSKINVIINELDKTISLNEDKINIAINLSITQNKKILIIDGENILKCFKIQHLIKKIIPRKEFNKYFNTWINGSYSEFSDVCSSNLSLTEYSSNIKFIEPYSSLYMDINTKFLLLKKIIESAFSDYICIAICNSKILSNDIIHDILIKNSVFIPISYERKDIREKDDHLLVYLYYYLSKKDIKFDLLSGDKFKWFTFINESINSVKNIKFLFNFDNESIEYVLSNAYSNDLIKINDNISELAINYFPILTFSNDNDFTNLLSNFFINKSFLKSDATLINNEYYTLLVDIYKYTKEWCKDFSIIFEFLEKYSKSEIFKILKKINQNNFKYKNIDFERFRLKIGQYKEICNMYVLIKHINININSLLINKVHVVIVQIFSCIVDINDSIYNNIFKIRKLSSDRSSINLFFMELGSMFTYVKKMGFFKKQL